MPPGHLLGPGVDAAEITSWKIPLSEVMGEGPRRRRRQEAPRARGMGQSRRCQRLGEQPRGDTAPLPPPRPTPPELGDWWRPGRGRYQSRQSQSQSAQIAAGRAPPRGGARRALGGRWR